MKLFMLECDEGYVKRDSTGCQCVPIEKATVINQSDANEIESFADFAKEAGLKNIRLVEILVAEGECIRKF